MNRHHLIINFVETSLKSRMLPCGLAMVVAILSLQCLQATTNEPGKLPPAATRKVDFAKDIQPILDKLRAERPDRGDRQ